VPHTTDQPETNNTIASLPTVSTPPVSIPLEEESEEEEPLDIVEKVLAYRLRTDGQKEYLLKWRGYPDEDNSWEQYSNLNENLQNFVDNNNIDVWQRKAPRPRRF
jgi:alpha-amylase/alpha-mannosidase (GH57 family)